MNGIKAEAEKTAAALAAKYNPYRVKSTVYNVGRETMYIYIDGKTYTAAALDAEYQKTAAADFLHGYNDRRAGYYDKWYRYNRMDDGNAYDAGSRYAADTCDDITEYRIIPA